ncbi:MAG: zeta toxin family protein [Actinobacteria bacterium]|nr:zeta toxin family protein [Actinomycetota bacterium]
MIWTAGRNQQLGELIAEVFRTADPVPREYRAVIAGGPPGADKTAALDQHGVDRSQFLTVSVNDVLNRMAARALIPVVADRPPLAGAELVHTEAQHVAKRIGLAAVNDGWNVILDVTLASRPSAESWTYALRFSDYSITAVYAGLNIEESVRRSAAAYQRAEEEYRQGRGYGGRYLPPDAIRALDGPAATAARDSIRWVSGAEPASVTAGRTRRGGLPGGAVSAMIDAYRRGQLSLDGLGLEFRARRWPAVPAVCPPALEPAAAVVDDLEPYVPGSFDDVVLAYDRGKLSDDEYEFLAEAANVSVAEPG